MKKFPKTIEEAKNIIVELRAEAISHTNNWKKYPDKKSLKDINGKIEKLWKDFEELETSLGKVEESEQSKQWLKELADKLELDVEGKTPEEINEIIKNFLEVLDEEVEAIPEENADETDEKIVKKSLSDNNKIVRDREAERKLKKFLDIESLKEHNDKVKKDKKGGVESLTWEEIIDDWIALKEKLGVDNDKIAEFTKRLEAIEGANLDNLIKWKIERDADFAKTKLEIINSLKNLKGNLSDDDLNQHVEDNWTEWLKGSDNIKQLAERTNIIYQFILEKERTIQEKSNSWLINNYIGESMWREIEIETKAQIEENKK